MSRAALPAAFGMILLIAVACGDARPAGPFALDGSPLDPFLSPGRATVLVFVRSDCPISNRYAPELSRLRAKYEGDGARFWLVYPDPMEGPSSIRDHQDAFSVSWTPLHDPEHALVRRLGMTVSPEAAVVDGDGRLVYRGRIDDRFPEYGVTRAPRTRDLDAAIQSVLAGEATELVTTRAIGCYLADLQ